MNQVGLAINSLRMFNQSKLTIMGTGSLNINQDSNNNEQIIMENSSELTINGSLTLLNSPTDAFYVENQALVTNNGFLARL